MYKEEHPAFEKPDDEDIKIWRYIDFTKFVATLDNQALFFARSDKFSDPFEGSISQVDINGQYKSKSPEFLSNLRKDIRKFIIINCWHMNEYESAAMWKLYLKSDEGVAIQSTFKRLTQCFNNYLDGNVYIGKVKYIDYKTEWMPKENIFYPYLHKRKSFEHERELRAIIQKIPGSDFTKELFDIGTYIPVELDILVEKIFVSPTAPEWFYDLVKSILGKYKFEKEVVKSSLNEDPVY